MCRRFWVHSASAARSLLKNLESWPAPLEVQFQAAGGLLRAGLDRQLNCRHGGAFLGHTGDCYRRAGQMTWGYGASGTSLSPKFDLGSLATVLISEGTKTAFRAPQMYAPGYNSISMHTSRPAEAQVPIIPL